jgi:alpha-beta hydrolase superfamily lysophospholipase
VTVVTRWVGGSSGTLTWLTVPDGGSQSGVVIAAPLGYQWWSTHHSLRVLARQLAAKGHAVSRFDYHGTGDSAGSSWDSACLSSWRQSLADAVGDLRDLGCLRVSVVGVRLGATLALLDGAALGVDEIVAWAPVSSGRRWVRELRLLGDEIPSDGGVDEEGPGVGAVAVAGMVFTAETLADVASLSLAEVDVAPAPRVLLIDDDPPAKLADHLTSAGVEVGVAAIAGGETALSAPSEGATPPAALLDAICDWVCSDAHVGPGVSVSSRPTTDLEWTGVALTETVMTLGPHDLVAIRTEPQATTRAPGTVVFLNTGSEPHVGPGRAWVEYARQLAAMGHGCYRVDWRGWGESPDDGYGPGRPYDPHTLRETLELVAAFRALGHEDIVLCGLCASAWVALRAILETDGVSGVLAINPQLYWTPGDPVEPTIAESRRRRAPEVAEIAAGAASGKWTELDIAGERPWAAAWLDAIAASATPVTMIFAEGDDGLVFLRQRLERRLMYALRAGLSVVEIPQIDHSMHRIWLRSRMVAVLAGAISEMLAASGDLAMRSAS